MTTAPVVGHTREVGVDANISVPATQPRQRSCTAEYKERILANCDGHPVGSAKRGAMLCRKGLYASHLVEWHNAVDAGGRRALVPKSRQRRPFEQVELERLRAKKKALEAEAEWTKTALEIAWKVHALLEQPSESADTDNKSNAWWPKLWLSWPR